ncbi:hypothetical protein Desaci_4321 [Desulfosporosinus acidiphilus SJ4]|uniref:SPOR domain-containing protein n=1 Tax=Desulfosporosinus acidiphilus (strain DSM 22704 / JCM 16185 / SJ4) TaxID=646529 RepID=I4DBJ7_DESAJ|nr:SPOR domain-containing protein [Desulfosporosinus acidiphilus]AFM43171.1 hypothetical protein Desaci_4321 [Desulfosporosinus acidiphilus SJ4]
MKNFERLRILAALVLGIIGLGLLTWGIGKVYLELVGHSGGITAQKVKNGGRPADQTDIFVLSKATFWTCQIGIFKSEENAQSCLKQLKELSYSGGIISHNPWIVVLGLGHTAEELNGLKQALAEKGIHALIKQVKLPERTFRVTGNGSHLTMELLANVNAILQEGINSQRLAEEFQLWNSLAGDYSPSQLVQLHNIYNLLREKSDPEEQHLLGLSLYFEAMRIINKFSGNNS